MSLSKPRGFASSGFMNVYLKNANDFAYNDLFKYIFEQMPHESVANLSDFTDVAMVKELFSSKFVPENFKCIIAKDTLLKNIVNFSKEKLQDLSSINHSCLNETIADANKFVIPANGCPEIIFKKNEDRALLLSKMSSEFSQKWVDCRKKCTANETCTSVKESNGIYTFINSKYGKDLDLYNEIQNRKENNKFVPNMSFAFEYKPVGSCTAANKCGEKNLSCIASDIVKKINAEILSANYQKCNMDYDCYVYKSYYNGCMEFATNVNPCSSMGFRQDRSDSQCYPSNFSNFINARLESLITQCGYGFSRGECDSNARNSSSLTKVKCEKNLCVLIKE